MSHTVNAGHFDTSEDNSSSTWKTEDWGNKQQSNNNSNNEDPIYTQPPLQYELLEQEQH